MAAPLRPTEPTRANPVVPPEWPAQAADQVVDVIAKVRDKTTKPIMLVSRGLVYGLIAAVLVSVALVMLVIILGRIWSNSMPGDLDIWVLYLILGVVCTLGGLWLLRKANQPVPAQP